MERRHQLQARKSKLNSASENLLRIRLLAVYSTIVLAALGFYFIQNTGLLEGGGIALPKLIWLAYAILFWFCLPFLLVLDKRINPVWRIILNLFLANMLLRAVIELVMMYVFHNWIPYYGIAHDAFTIALLGGLLLLYRDSLQYDIFFGFALTVMLMLIVEILFVFYMITNVIQSDSDVYFVPEDARYSGVLGITWLVVLLLSVYMFVFTRRWLRGEFIRTSG